MNQCPVHLFPGVLNYDQTKKGVVVPLAKGQIVKNSKFVNYDDGSEAVFKMAKIDVSVLILPSS